jgi:hypothetical protein
MARILAGPSDQQTESAMKVPQTVAEVLNNHVVFELECIDRMYLNVMVPRLQREQEVAAFFRFHRGHRFASSALMEPISKDFVARMQQYADQYQVPVVPFDEAPYKGRKKDDITQEFIARQGAKEGVMFLGKAQEKTRVCRTERRRGQDGKSTYPVDCQIHRDDQPVLLVYFRRGLRAVLFEVWQLLSLQRQGLPQWPRMAQAPTGQGRYPV